MPDESRPPPLRNADLRIREARPSDIDRLAQLEASAFATDRLTRRRLAAFVNSPSACLLLAWRDGEAVGYVLVLTRRGSRAARLYSLAVAPELAGRGIGSILLGAAEDAALARGADALRLEVRGDNPGAIRLYEQRGYRPMGRRENYYQDGMTAVRYSRDLGGGSIDTAPPSLGQAA